MTDEIEAFRDANSAALYDSGHAKHAQTVDALAALYRDKFPEPVEDDAASLPEPMPATENAVADIYEQQEPVSDPDFEAPASPDDYEFATHKMPQWVDVEGDEGVERVELEWSSEVEQQVRGWLHSFDVPPAEAMALESFYRMEAEGAGFTAEREQELAQQSQGELIQRYGERWIDAVKAARKVASEGGPELLAFLQASNLGSHPRVIEAFIKRAIKRGYFKG